MAKIYKLYFINIVNSFYYQHLVFFKIQVPQTVLATQAWTKLYHK